MAYVTGLSTSLPTRTRFVKVSSGVVTLWLFAIGPSFNGMTVMDTVPVASNDPSLTVNWNTSGQSNLSRAYK
jgi:hypothetical protein